MTKAEALKELLRNPSGYYNDYYDLIDAVIVEELKQIIFDLQSPNNDPYDSVDNKAATLSAFYKVLEWYTKPSEYEAFVKQQSVGWGIPVGPTSHNAGHSF